MAIGTAAALAFGMGAIGSTLVGSLAKQNPKLAAPQALPQAPNPADAAEKGQEIASKKRRAATQSVYTSPLGAAGEADVARKTLLGR